MWRTKGLKLKCGHCNQSCKLQCDGCEDAFYCSEDHQRLHWKVHKLSCKSMKKVKVERSPETNRRILIAKENFQKGDTIFREDRMIRAPDDYLRSPEEVIHDRKSSSCIVCSKKMDVKLMDKKIRTRLCSRCYWPVCSTQCDEFHELAECDFFKGYPIPPKSYFTTDMPPWKFIFIIRALLLKMCFKEDFNNFMELDVNNIVEEYSKILGATGLKSLKSMNIPVPQAILHKRTVLRNAIRLMKHYRMEEFLKEEKLIDNAIQILEWNCVRLDTGSSAHNGLFKLTSAASQSCMPNALFLITPDMQSHCVATKDIKIGDKIEVSKDHSNIMCDTYHRKLQLFENFITCKCTRCTDPTELGSYYSAIKCSNFEEESSDDVLEPGCGSGNLLPYQKGFDNITIWKCDSCKIERPETTVARFWMGILEDQQIVATTEKFLTNRNLINSEPTSLILLKGAESILQFVKKYQNYFHPNHYFICDMKYNLISRLSDGIHELFVLDQQDKYHLQIIEAAQIIYESVNVLSKNVELLYPGVTLPRANLIYFKQQAFAFLIPDILKAGLKTDEEKTGFKKKLQEIKELRDEARSVFALYLDHNENQPSLTSHLSWMDKDGLIYRYVKHKYAHVLYGCPPKKENILEEIADNEESDFDHIEYYYPTN